MIRFREKQALSHCRQLARELQAQRQFLETNLLSREPLVEGCLVVTRRICGKAGCRCAASKRMRHGPYLSLSILRQGQTRRIHLPREWGDCVKAGLEAARRYREAFREWRALDKRMAGLWREVERCRKHVPYEPKRKGR
jgi:hypothetical protein